MGYHTVHFSLPWSTSLIKGFGFVVISSNPQGVCSNSFSIQNPVYVHCTSVVNTEIT